MKLKPYVEVLKMAKQKVDASLAPMRANKAKKQAELEIAKMEEKMATLESNIYEMCAEKEINFDKIINSQDEYSLLERRKKQFEKIIEEMFPAKKCLK